MDHSTASGEGQATSRGCLGCLVDGYDHSCGYVGLGVFLRPRDIRAARRRRREEIRRRTNVTPPETDPR